MHPCVSNLQAVFTALRAGRNIADLIEMSTLIYHTCVAMLSSCLSIYVLLIGILNSFMN